MTLLEAAYAYILSILNADAISSNAWLTANIDKVQGIATIILCARSGYCCCNRSSCFALVWQLVSFWEVSYGHID